MRRGCCCAADARAETRSAPLAASAPTAPPPPSSPFSLTSSHGDTWVSTTVSGAPMAGTQEVHCSVTAQSAER